MEKPGRRQNTLNKESRETPWEFHPSRYTINLLKAPPSPTQKGEKWIVYLLNPYSLIKLI
jgi:hypothetical protein